MKKRGKKGKGEDGEGGEGRREERRALLHMIWLMDISVTMYQFINLSINLQECPKCHATIEKNGGCNHMHCSTCKAEFCWVCLGPWEPHGSSW